MIDSSRLRKRRPAPALRYSRRHDWLKPLWVLGAGCLSVLVVSLLVLSRTDMLLTSALLRKDDKAWGADVLHVVVTRFMQDQPKLLHLARARLLLFQTICLPSMIQQSTKQFIWIIQTDPQLDKNIRHALRQLLKPYPHFFLIGSNHQIQGKTFRTIGKDFLQSPMYSGNVKLLRQAYWVRNTIPLLQTRLDADDGLQKAYLETLQEHATQLFRQDGLNWYYWCIKRHFEWYSDANALNPVEHSKLCITPGLTVGLGVAPLAQEPPLDLAHDVLFKTVAKQGNACGAAVCVRMVEEVAVGAVRSRTWTSAGMMDIFAPAGNAIPQEQLWELCNSHFGVQNLQQVGAYLKAHIIDIAKDNLEGQCTNGHSCKLKSVEALQRLIDVQREGTTLQTGVT